MIIFIIIIFTPTGLPKPDCDYIGIDDDCHFIDFLLSNVIIIMILLIFIPTGLPKPDCD